MLIGFAGSATAGVIVTGSQIKDNTITSADLKNESLYGVDVKDESLTQADFFDPVVGPTGPKGDQGPTGQPGSSGLVYKVEGVNILKNSSLTWSVVCPPGTVAISGGGSNDGLGQLIESAPRDGARSGWHVGVRNPTNTTIAGFAWALCVTAS